HTLESIPIELDVAGISLPDTPPRAMVYYEASSLKKRIGDGDRAERHLWRLLHRHRIAPLHGAVSVTDVDHHLPALDGSAYTSDAGYEGPAAGIGDGVLSIGTYGDLGAPDTNKLQTIEAIVDRL